MKEPRNLLCDSCNRNYILERIEERVMAKIDILVDRCIGCRLCEAVCSARFVGNFNSARAAVYVKSSLPEDTLIRPFMCIHCDEHPCVDSCPVAAIVKNEETGLYAVDKNLCTGCGACVQACPYSGIRLAPVDKLAIKCDFCNGQPRCVDVCPKKTITVI